MRGPGDHFQTQFFRLTCLLLLLLPLILLAVVPESAAEIDRNRKNLLKIQLKTDKKRGKSRIVMRLNQGGYYETEEEREKQKFIIKLFDFHNYGARPIKVVNDPIVKGVNIIQHEQYLEIAVYLRVRTYSFKVSLFESPAMCVVDIKALEPLSEKKTETGKAAAPVPKPQPAQEQKNAAADATTPPDGTAKKPKPTKSELALAVAKAVKKTQPEAKAKAPAPVKAVAPAPPEKAGPEIKPESGPKVQEKLPVPGPDAAAENAVDKVKAPAAELEEKFGQVESESQPEPKTGGKTPAGAGDAATVKPSTTLSPTAPAPAAPAPERSPVPPASAAAEKPAPVKPALVAKTAVSPPAEPVSDSEPTSTSLPEAPAAAAEKAPPEIERQPGQDIFDKGLAAYQDGKFADAEELFNQVATKFPKTPLGISAQFRSYDARAQSLLADKGSHSLMSGLVDEFLTAVRAHSDNPDAPWALLQVARLYENMEFFYEATGVYKALIKRYPQSPFATAANFALARLNFSLKRYENAYDDFSDLLKRQPDGGFSVYAHYYRANALYELGEFKKALAEYRVGIALDSDFLHRDPLSLYLLGSTYHRLQRYREAREYFLMMRNLFPNDENTPQALAKIGEILVAEKNLPEAMLMFTTVVKEFPGSEGDVVSRLKMAILGQDQKARRKLELINSAYGKFLDSESGYLYLIEHYPESPFSDIARLDLGRLYFEKAEYEKARQVFGQMLERRLEPQLREAAFVNLREVIYVELKKDFKEEKFAHIVALQNEYGKDFLSHPSAVYPFLWIAEALHQEGFNEGALAEERALKKLHPKPGPAQIIDWGIADILVRTGRYDEAAKFIGEIDFKRLQPLWRARMRLLWTRIQVHRGLVDAAFASLRQAEKELPAAAIRERVVAGALETNLWLQKKETRRALDILRATVGLAFAHPEKVVAERRQLLGYRLARMLYEQADYGEALSWFTKIELLTPRAGIDEVLYWQLRCQIALGRGPAVAVLIKRMRSEFPNSPWTASAVTAGKDFSWRQEKNSLK